MNRFLGIWRIFGWLAVVSVIIMGGACPKSLPKPAADYRFIIINNRAELDKNLAAVCRKSLQVNVPFKYPDNGKIWIPSVVFCKTNEAHLIILLHGTLSREELAAFPNSANWEPVEKLLSQLIQTEQIAPIILAEPVHYYALTESYDRLCSHNLYNEAFDILHYLAFVKAKLKEFGIKVDSVSLVGHSGSGCCKDGGIYNAIQTWPEFYLVGLMDTCCLEDYYSEELRHTFLNRDTIVINISRGSAIYPRFENFEETFIGPAYETISDCPKTTFSSCKRSLGHPFYSFTTQKSDSAYHYEIVKDFFKEILVRFFK